MAPTINLQPAFVLHTRPFRDSSALVDFLCLDYGRIRAVARGVRRPTARMRGLLQPFQPLLVTLGGRGELMTLRSAESSTAALSLGGQRLYSGLYINELVSRLVGFHEPHPALFRIYQQALLGLHEQQPLEPVLREFELQLLSELGYGIDLRREAGGQRAIEPSAYYLFDPAHGFERIAGAGANPPVNVFQGEDLLGLQARRWDERVRPAAKRLLRQALDSQLGDKPLLSRSLFRTRRLSGASKNR